MSERASNRESERANERTKNDEQCVKENWGGCKRVDIDDDDDEEKGEEEKKKKKNGTRRAHIRGSSFTLV